jgi:hypothetical protein
MKHAVPNSPEEAPGEAPSVAAQTDSKAGKDPASKTVAEKLAKPPKHKTAITIAPIPQTGQDISYQ